MTRPVQPDAQAPESALPRLSAALPRAPEEHVLLRLAQLLLLLDEVTDAKGVGLERLGYYDFFAANPFAVIGPDERAVRAELHAAGFDERQLAYASTGARFANRRHRLQHDVALLVAYGLVGASGHGYAITPAGRGTAARFLSLYAGQYRAAARVIHRRFRPLSDTALIAQARSWLRRPSLVLDLYGAPDDPEDAPYSASTRTPGPPRPNNEGTDR
jgi:hypothetical protein